MVINVLSLPSNKPFLTNLVLFGCPGKNSSFLRVVRCRSLAEEYGVDSVNKDEISKLEGHFLSDHTMQSCLGCFKLPAFSFGKLNNMIVCPQPHAWTIQTARWSSTSCFALLIASISSTPATQVQAHTVQPMTGNGCCFFLLHYALCYKGGDVLLAHHAHLMTV